MEAFNMTSKLSAQASPCRLADLVQGVLADNSLPDDCANILVSGIATDSRNVIAGDLFIALNGLTVDGRNYISDAIEQGAVAVLAETEETFTVVKQQAVSIISLQNLTQNLSEIAGRFYNSPTEKLTVIGVTGTNGKTSCSHLIASLAAAQGHQSGLIGTLGYGRYQHEATELQQTGFTTPDAVQLQACMQDLHEDDCDIVAIEVSSHALAQHRVDAINFDIAVLTNLSHDHLDFHKDIASYAAAKRRLFSFAGINAAVINADDEFGERLAQELQAHNKVFTYSTHKTQADVFASNTRYSLNSISSDVVSPWGSATITIPLIGEFNLSNALAALTAMLAAGGNFAALVKAFSHVSAVKGRMEIVGDAAEKLTANKMVVVDYAHTPQALEMALAALRPHTKGQLWCVFGCGGDRDNDKRAAMGRIAKDLADCVVITSDNPRSEPPEQIIDDVLLGVDDMQYVNVEPDRAAAITFAIKQAAAGDLILVAGKGHEQFQIVGDLTLPFSDVDVVRQCLFQGQGQAQVQDQAQNASASSFEDAHQDCES